MKIFLIFFIVFIVLSLTTPAFASIGIPLLLKLNFILFVLASIFVIVSEYIYMKHVFNTVGRVKLLQWTFLMNLASTIVGAILFPLLIAFLAIWGPEGPFTESYIGQLLFPMVTWIMGSDYPFKWLALVFTGIGYIVTFLLTVFIEFKVLLRLSKSTLSMDASILKQHVYSLNGISYGGIIIIGIIVCIFLQNKPY
jgi:hypothetical protein